MKSLKSYILLLVGVGLSISFAFAQTKTYRVEVSPRVSNQHLLLDFYIQRTAGTNFSLASSNLSIHIAGGGVDQAQAVVLTGSQGPWDAATDAQGYGSIEARFIDNNDVWLNVLCKSQFTSQNPGPGQPVTTTRTRIATVSFPITNPAASATISWQNGITKVHNWSATQITTSGEFVVTQPTVALCETPAKPTLTFTPQSAYCAGQPVTLTSSFTGTNQWYLNGQPITGATASTYAATQSGSYTVAATVGTCISPVYDAAAFTFISTTAPVVTLSGNQLTSNITTGIQWHLDGQAINGATAASYSPTQSGVYKAVLTNTCGQFASNEYTWLLGGTNGPAPDKAASLVSPNPFVGSTTLTYSLTKAQEVTITVSNSSGNVIGTVLKETKGPGMHTYRFTPIDHAAAIGIYLLSINSDELKQTHKLIVSQ